MLEQIEGDVSEIILVDGNSTDATLITARSIASTSGWYPRKASERQRAQNGLLAATGDIIVTMDADGSMAPGKIRHTCIS